MLGISETSQGVLTTDRLIIQMRNILFLQLLVSVRSSIHPCCRGDYQTIKKKYSLNFNLTQIIIHRANTGIFVTNLNLQVLVCNFPRHM